MKKRKILSVIAAAAIALSCAVMPRGTGVGMSIDSSALDPYANAAAADLPTWVVQAGGYIEIPTKNVDGNTYIDIDPSLIRRGLDDQKPDRNITKVDPNNLQENDIIQVDIHVPQFAVDLQSYEIELEYDDDLVEPVFWYQKIINAYDPTEARDPITDGWEPLPGASVDGNDGESNYKDGKLTMAVHRVSSYQERSAIDYFKSDARVLHALFIVKEGVQDTVRKKDVVFTLTKHDFVHEMTDTEVNAYSTELFAKTQDPTAADFISISTITTKVWTGLRDANSDTTIGQTKVKINQVTITGKIKGAESTDKVYLIQSDYGWVGTGVVLEADLKPKENGKDYREFSVVADAGYAYLLLIGDWTEPNCEWFVILDRDTTAKTVQIKDGTKDIIEVNLYGDVNLDGKVSPKDATEILRYLVHKSSALDITDANTTKRKRLANVLDDGDGINAKDATQILRKTVGLQSIFDTRFNEQKNQFLPTP